MSAGCLHVDSGFANGTTIHFYVKNTCDKTLELPNYSYNVETKDGTTIESGQWAFRGNKRIFAGERREEQIDIESDSRAASVLIRAID
jgi:hypothetical protein